MAGSRRGLRGLLPARWTTATMMLFAPFGCGDPDAAGPVVPNQSLPPSFFGLDLQFDMGTLPGIATWPNDAGFDRHQVVRAWLGGGGLWADIQRNGRGQPFDWERLDSYMQKAKRFDQRVLYVVVMTPTFAVAAENRSELCAWPDLYPGGCNPPDDWNDPQQASCLPPADAYSGPNCTYKEFMVALVRRFRGSGVQDGCPESDALCHGVISYYELGNEMDSFYWPYSRFWSGTASGTDTDSPEHALSILVHMVRDAAEVIRREDPSATIVAPSFTGYDGVRYFEQFFSQAELNPIDFVDAVSFHGYSGIEFEHSPEQVRDLVEAYVDARTRVGELRPAMLDKPLFDTEGSWGWNFYGPCSQDENPCIHEVGKQTAYLARWFLHQWDMGIEMAVWFEWGSGGWGEIWCPEGKGSEDHHAGCEQLQNDDPQLNQAGIAYAEIIHWLRGATRTHRCKKDGSIWKCPIRRPDLNNGQGTIVWHDDWDGFETVLGISQEVSTCWHLSGARGPVTTPELPVFSIPMLCH